MESHNWGATRASTEVSAVDGTGCGPATAPTGLQGPHTARPWGSWPQSLDRPLLLGQAGTDTPIPPTGMTAPRLGRLGTARRPEPCAAAGRRSLCLRARSVWGHGARGAAARPPPQLGQQRTLGRLRVCPYVVPRRPGFLSLMLEERLGRKVEEQSADYGGAPALGCPWLRLPLSPRADS